MLPLKTYIQHPAKLLVSLLKTHGSFIPDKLYLKILFSLKMGYWPDLKNPKTFNEKLQWLKLYDRKPEYTQMVDKVEAKKYVANIIGEEYIIPTLGVWERPEDIDWETLPKQFVLKTTHGSGSSGVVICKDKDTFDREAAVKKLSRAMKKNVYKTLREWPYKGISPRILAEKHLTNGGRDIIDYKVYCFSGEPQFIFVCDNRFTETGMTVDCYTTSWEHVDVKVTGHDNYGIHPRPKRLEEMLRLAKALSSKMLHVRTDFYCVGNDIYFSELTFFSSSGLEQFEPESFDHKWGELIKLKS